MSKYFIVYDFETGSVDPNKTQPLQLGAIAVDYIRLEVVPKSEFNSYIRPVFKEEECKELNIDMVQQGALDVNKIEVEKLKAAPTPSVVWKNFTEYVENYHSKKGKWGAPIKVGYNNYAFDDIILERLCGKEPYKFGPWDEERGEETLFYPGSSVDVRKNFIWPWTESIDEIKSVKLDSIREWLGYSTEGAHDALNDVKITADLLIRFLRLHRHFAPKVKFGG